MNLFIAATNKLNQIWWKNKVWQKEDILKQLTQQNVFVLKIFGSWSQTEPSKSNLHHFQSKHFVALKNYLSYFISIAIYYLLQFVKYVHIFFLYILF